MSDMTIPEVVAMEVDHLARKLGEGPDFVTSHAVVKTPVKLSVVIPYMQVDGEKPRILQDTLSSFTGADEIIVVVNWKGGYAKPINEGLGLAKGDFLLVMNDDLDWGKAHLKRLCDETAVTSPCVNGKMQSFWGCAFCIPRWVYEKVGGLYEGYRISYFDDADYYNKLTQHNVPTLCKAEVNVTTVGGRTLERFPDRNDFFEENHRHFLERWRKEPEF